MVGVDEWSDLIGKSVRVKIEGGSVVEIGHYLKEKWFIKNYEFKEL